MTIKAFTDAVKQAQLAETRSMTRIPHHLAKDPCQDYLWSWRENTLMYKTKHPIESEMTYDSRDEASRMRAKYNDPVDSLNSTVTVLKNSPELIHRHDGRMQIHHLVH